MKSLAIERSQPVTPEEIGELRVAVGWEPCENTQAQVLRGSYCYFTARDRQRLAAFLNVISDGVGDALLVNIMVHPQYQKQGLGTQLVSAAVAALTDDGIQCIWTTFAPEKEPFYRANGFHLLRSGVIDNAAAHGQRE